VGWTLLKLEHYPYQQSCEQNRTVKRHEVKGRKFNGGRFSREMWREKIYAISFCGVMVSYI
jgi:hypothetical protein